MTMRLSKYPPEIKSVISRALSSVNDFLIWQRNENEEIIFERRAVLKSIDDLGMMTFSVDEEFEIQGSSLFFAVKDSSVVFKSTEFRLIDKSLICRLPLEVKYRESRKHERRKFSYKDHKQIEIIYTNEKDEAVTIVAHVLDVSESGMCIILEKETLKNILGKKIFNIKTISSDLGLRIGKGCVMNVRRYKSANLKHGDMFAIGISLVQKSD